MPQTIRYRNGDCNHHECTTLRRKLLFDVHLREVWEIGVADLEARCDEFVPEFRFSCYRIVQLGDATDGVAGAVLLRAAAVEAGIDAAQVRRGDLVRPAALARGPGNLCSALGITMDDNGIDLFGPNSSVKLALGDRHDGVEGPRVGVSKAADRTWRFWLAGRPEVSLYRRSPRAPAPGESD